ncbi:MAG TPA: extensin family protein [Polyangiaceae bacterium]
MLRVPPFCTPLALLLAATALTSRDAHASNPYLDVPAEAQMRASPAYRYANATDDEVRKWIIARRIPFVESSETVLGVRLPGRLTGTLHGVSIHGTDPRHVQESPYEILDGRLALALDDFCELLFEHGIVELVHFTMFRPSRTATQPLTRHPGALAIDLGLLKRADGTWLKVKRDFDPAPGQKTCGFGAKHPASEAGQFLQTLVCAARERGIFHYALTPHFDSAHADHFHLEIKPMVKWFLYN